MEIREDIWTVIRYRPRPGFEDEFEQALKRLGHTMLENKPYEFTNDFVKLDNGEYAQIARMPNLDATVGGQIDGLEWLDSVDHLLERYENDNRTQAFSGLVLD